VRRKVGLVLVGLGAFLIALAPLFRFYVAHQVLAAPLDIYEKTTLRADNATYLDAAKLQIRKGATVTATNTTRGDVHAGDNKIAVWDSFTSVEDVSANVKIDTQVQRAVFNRRTSDLQNGRGAQVNNDPNVRQTGVGLFWPVGVKKKTYQYFDTTTKRAWPITYAGEDRTQGIRTYRFVQTIPPTVTDTIKPGVPGSLLGMPAAQVAKLPGYDKKTRTVPVNRVYQATTTAWVDPRTGAPVNQEQRVVTTLRTNDGVDRLVVGDLDLKMLPSSQKHLVDRSDGDATYVGIVKTWLPYGGGAVGIVFVVVGLALAVSGRRRPAHRGSGEATRPSDTGSGSGSGSGEGTPSPEPA
jgi:hypothetical protein